MAKVVCATVPGKASIAATVEASLTKEYDGIQ
jgi:hypothetical protein